MKNRYIIIPAITIVILGVITAFIFLTKDKSSTENNVAEVSIPVETSAPEPTPTPDPTPKPTIEPISTPETTVAPIVTPEPTEEPIPEPSDIKLTDEERIYNTLAETMGLSVEEVKALMAESESSSSTSTSSGNTGGGSSQIATPSTNQSSANENNFVTPETNNGANNNSGSDARPGEITVDIWGNAAAAGDGGEYTSDPNDIHFNQ